MLLHRVSHPGYQEWSSGWISCSEQVQHWIHTRLLSQFLRSSKDEILLSLGAASSKDCPHSDEVFPYIQLRAVWSMSTVSPSPPVSYCDEIKYPSSMWLGYSGWEIDDISEMDDTYPLSSSFCVSYRQITKKYISFCLVFCFNYQWPPILNWEL